MSVRRGVTCGVSLAALWVVGCGLKEQDAVSMLERELERPVKEFCCTRIDSPTVRATCESEAEAKCGHAASGKVTLSTFDKYSGGQVFQVTFTFTGPHGHGRGSAQFLERDSWHVSELHIDPPP